MYILAWSRAYTCTVRGSRVKSTRALWCRRVISSVQSLVSIAQSSVSSAHSAVSAAEARFS